MESKWFSRVSDPDYLYNIILQADNLALGFICKLFSHQHKIDYIKVFMWDTNFRIDKKTYISQNEINKLDLPNVSEYNRDVFKYLFNMQNKKIRLYTLYSFRLINNLWS